MECLGVIDAEGGTGENDADDVGVILRELVVGEDLAERVQLAHAAGYELCGLGTEIQDDDFLHNRIDKIAAQI